ncbi:MAG: efflux RND transporter periplasmic adaptor subunit [Planctomycetota bacterium]
MSRLVTLILVLAGAGLAFALWRSQQRVEPLKVSGLLEAHEIRLGSRIGGRVARVHVAEGDTVATGQALVELETFDLRERRAQAAALVAERTAERDRLELGYRPEEVAQARARRDQAKAYLDRMEHGARAQEVAAARARVDQAQAELVLVQQRWKRQRELFDERVAAQDAMDQADNELKAAQAIVVARQEELALLTEGSRSEDVAAAKAQLAEAEAALALRQAGYTREERAAAAATVDAAGAALAAIDRQLEETRIEAPCAAVVEALDLRAGDLVAPNAPVLSLREPAPLWVRAYVPEALARFRVGARVAVTVDAFPGRRFAATITFVAGEAEFTPRNAQTPQERSKQVLRIKATLDEGLDQLRAGMAADVWLDPALEQ